jgi:hypothetical protein
MKVYDDDTKNQSAGARGQCIEKYSVYFYFYFSFLLKGGGSGVFFFWGGGGGFKKYGTLSPPCDKPIKDFKLNY